MGMGGLHQIQTAGVQHWMTGWGCIRSMRETYSPLVEDEELERCLAGLHCRSWHASSTDETHTPAAATPEAASWWSGQLDHHSRSVAARHNARTLPPRNTFPGLRLRQGCNTSRKFLPQGMGYDAIHEGPSNGWIEEEDY